MVERVGLFVNVGMQAAGFRESAIGETIFVQAADHRTGVFAGFVVVSMRRQT